MTASTLTQWPWYISRMSPAIRRCAHCGKDTTSPRYCSDECERQGRRNEPGTAANALGCIFLLGVVAAIAFGIFFAATRCEWEPGETIRQESYGGAWPLKSHIREAKLRCSSSAVWIEHNDDKYPLNGTAMNRFSGDADARPWQSIVRTDGNIGVLISRGLDLCE